MLWLGAVGASGQEGMRAGAVAGWWAAGDTGGGGFSGGGNGGGGGGAAGGGDAAWGGAVGGVLRWLIVGTGAEGGGLRVAGAVMMRVWGGWLSS